MKTPAEWLYGLFALLGVVGPWRFNLEWMRDSPTISGLTFISDAMANPASSSPTVDILIVFACFCVWLLVEARRLKMKWVWLLIPYAALIALASAFPLFLLLRSRRIRNGDASCSKVGGEHRR